jgi:hypothetical protein
VWAAVVEEAEAAYLAGLVDQTNSDPDFQTRNGMPIEVVGSSAKDWATKGESDESESDD